MPDHVLGVAAMGGDANDVCDTIAHFEEIGLRAAWLTTGGAGLDALTLLAASAVETDTILLGTAIVPTWPRHPVVTVQQVQAIAQLAPGRLRLGVGPSHETSMSRIFGVDYREPLANLFEYIAVLRGLLHEGAVEFRGDALHVDRGHRLANTGRAHHGLGAATQGIRAVRSDCRWCNQLALPAELPREGRAPRAATRGSGSRPQGTAAHRSSAGLRPRRRRRGRRRLSRQRSPGTSRCPTTRGCRRSPAFQKPYRAPGAQRWSTQCSRRGPRSA